MRHGWMVRTLAVAAVVLAAGGSTRAADGCNSCAPAAKADCGPCEKKSILSKVKASTASTCCDAKFALGSSRGFFAACNPGCSDLPISACGRDRQRCDMPKYGTGIGQPANNCGAPFSFLNR
jgi:hypothetical protein